MRWRSLFFFFAGFAVYFAFVFTGAEAAEPKSGVRVATYHVELTRDGPGLALRDIRRAHPQVKALRQIIHKADPDILLLTGIAYDHQQKTLAEFANFIGNYPYYFARPPSSGYPSGYDLNLNGRSTDRQDALSYGRFPGHQGIALLSKFPFDNAWKNYGSISFKKLYNAPNSANNPQKSANGKTPKTLQTPALKHPIGDLPFSSSGHWVVPIQISPTRKLHLLAFRASPPLTTNNEAVSALNRLRNHSELSFWVRYLRGEFGALPKDFILLGNANTDPKRGDGARALIAELIAHPRLQDPLGNHPTVYWSAKSNLPPMRVDYILPARHLNIGQRGLSPPKTRLQQKASQHRLIWVDVE